MKRQETTKRKEVKVRITGLPSDRWEDFKKLRLESLKSDPLAFLSSYEEEVDFEKEVWQGRIKNVIFAVVKNEPIGMMTFILRNRKKNDHVADIFAVYVSRKYRGIGIGDRLLKRAIHLLKKNSDISKISLGVCVEQTPAVNLYLKNKFKVVGVLEKEMKVDGNFYDELIMERSLM
jgi:ribosomal protein S18 acetylase RimI-like enzyme